jgi:hypothetical protein
MVFMSRSSGRPNLMDTTSFFIMDYVIERHFTILFEVVSSSNSVSSVRVVDVENRKFFTHGYAWHCISCTSGNQAIAKMQGKKFNQDTINQGSSTCRPHAAC